MSGTCKTCKWWKQTRKGGKLSEHGKCDLVGYVPESRAAFEIVATAADDWGLTVDLQTGPDFGCIHHDERALATICPRLEDFNAKVTP